MEVSHPCVIRKDERVNEKCANDAVDVVSAQSTGPARDLPYGDLFRSPQGNDDNLRVRVPPQVGNEQDRRQSDPRYDTDSWVGRIEHDPGDWQTCNGGYCREAICSTSSDEVALKRG